MPWNPCPSVLRNDPDDPQLKNYVGPTSHQPTLPILLAVSKGAKVKWLHRHLAMYVCVVTHLARVWIDRVRLPILLVVS